MKKTLLIGLIVVAAAAAWADAATPARKLTSARRRHVDLVICLDTSGSLSGLIESAKLTLWAVFN